MFSTLRSRLRRWAGRSELELASQPVIAGYRTTSPGWVRIALLSALVTACVAYGFTFAVMAPARVMPFTIPLAVLGGIILWTLPPGNYAPKAALEPLLVGFFASMAIWPNYLAIEIGNLPWITLTRLTSVPLAILFLACLSISRSFRSELWEIVNTQKMTFRLIVALNILWVISVPLSIDPASSINVIIFAQLGATIIFFVSCYLFSRPGFGEFFVYVFLLLMVVLCVMGIWEWRRQDVLWAGHIPSFLKVDDPLAVKILEKYAAGGLRVRVSHTTPLGLAELLGLSAPFAVHIAMGSYRFLVRLAAGLYLPLAVFVILLTDSRLGVVAACGAVMFYLLVWAVLRWRRLRGSLFAPAIVLSYPITLAAFFAATFLVGRLRTEFWGTGRQQSSTQGRIDQWEMGIPKIIEHPLGHGIGQAGKALNFRNLRGELTIDTYWLSILLEIGFAGFVVYYGLMLYTAFAAMRTAVQGDRSREVRLLLPITVLLVNFVIVKMVFSQEANHPLIFIMLGAVVGLSHLAGKQAEQTAART